MHEYVGYYRKSVGRRGISQQRRSVRLFIGNLGGAVIDERDDEDRTAFRKLSDERPPRPGFDDILAMLRARPGLRLAAWHIDRITRDVEDALDLCKTGCYVVTVQSGEYDLSTANGRKRFIADANDARGEIDHNIDRIIERKDEHAAEGRWMGGPVPFGWQAVPRDDDDEPALLELHEAEAPLLRAAKDDILAGRACRPIWAGWNTAGWRTRRGNPWQATTFRAVMLRPRNAGLHEHRGQVRPGAQWPPLWDEEDHEALCALFADPARRTSPGNGRRYLLPGIALCAECGTAVKIHISDHVPYYACARSARHPMRRAGRVDEFVTETVLQRLELPDAAALLRPDVAPQRSVLVARRARVRALMDSRGIMHEDGLLTDEEFTRGRRKHLAELEEIKGALEALNRADVLAAFADAPRAAWEQAPLGTRRAVVAALVAVTLFAGRQGRPRGWTGGGYFDYDSVDIHWLRRLPSDG